MKITSSIVFKDNEKQKRNGIFFNFINFQRFSKAGTRNQSDFLVRVFECNSWDVVGLYFSGISRVVWKGSQFTAVQISVRRSQFVGVTFQELTV